MATAFNNFDMFVIFYISKFNDGKSVHASVSHCALYLKKNPMRIKTEKRCGIKGCQRKCIIALF